MKKKSLSHIYVLMGLLKEGLQRILLFSIISPAFWGLFHRLEKKPETSPVAIKITKAEDKTVVDNYWGSHTVMPTLIKSRTHAQFYRNWRFQSYPLFKEFMDLYGQHPGETVLDYGCGPGTDVLGFYLFSNAKKIIGIDISQKALTHAVNLLNLFGVAADKIELIMGSDSIQRIALETESVDYLQSLGVVMHTSAPEEYLKEFYRILRKGKNGKLMVYNRDSVWFHLYVPYVLKLVRGQYSSLSDDAVFQKSTDGDNCPYARCYSDEEFIPLLQKIGFTVEYAGGYLSNHELLMLTQYLRSALKDDRLSKEHKIFLENLEYDKKGYPLFKNKYAGIGGVYKISK